MYVKSEKELFRRRRRGRRGRLLRALIVLILIGVGAYYGYQQLSAFAEPFTSGSAPPPSLTPIPTATPSASLLASEGEDAYWRGAVGEAIEAYQAALDIEPNQTELYLELARLLTFHGRPERGLEMARQALLRQPESARAWAVLCMTYDWLGLPDRAVSLCEKAVELDPTLPVAYAYLAEAYVDAGQWHAANAAVSQAMELDPESADVLRNRAYVLENQGNYSGAIQGYREALARYETLTHFYLAIGRNASALANLTLAREAYMDALEVDPEHPIALDQLGWTELLLGDYESAKTHLLAALDIDPGITDAYGHLGTLYFHQRNYEDAIEMLQPALANAQSRARRRTTLFSVTIENANAIGPAPSGPEVVLAAFVHPEGLDTPLRAQVLPAGGWRPGGLSSQIDSGAGGQGDPGQGDSGEAVQGATVQGLVRLDPVSGRYSLSGMGIPPVPPEKVYVGWFLSLYAPGGDLIRTEPIFPAPNGEIKVEGATGVVKGPPIENYYTLALSHYLLDQCDHAIPLIQTALRIDPEDENARKTLELCQ